MVLSAAFIVPHGALILDALPSHTDGRYELQQAMVSIANQITSIKPDIILVTSPHGISLSDNFGIYFNESAHGTAEWDNNYQEFQVEVKIDLEFTEELFTHLKNNHQPISKISAFSRSVSIPMRWGESVPLWFLKDLQSTKYVFLSQPQKRFDPTDDFKSETKELGINLLKFLDSHIKRVVVLISADLSHTHQKEGPYGFTENAERVDQLFEDTIKSGDLSQITTESYENMKKALCCGFTGFQLLHGLLSNSNLTGQILSRKTPTYYGMMVASFLPKK
jgi:aromatic ring-opening dioxygenase LigB subunit